MSDSSKTTTDHDEIKKWAEDRGGKPATVSSTSDGGDPGVIKIMFPDDSDSDSDRLEEISWEDFFEKFDESGLALLHQDTTADGEKSKFSKLVKR